MALNKARGQMYPFLNDYPTKGANRGYTINFVKGVCSYKCVYCSCKKYWETWPALYLDRREFNTNLGTDNFIFIGSSCDLFAPRIPASWINDTLKYCKQFDNKYLFQTKNPKRLLDFIDDFPKNTILGTTIESDRQFPNYSKAPSQQNRLKEMLHVSYYKPKKIMISIEPILTFNLKSFVEGLKKINPKFISIGADSKGHNLLEPSKEKVDLLIKELRKFTEVRIKDNLKRLE